jgi:hypothetical protein
VIFCQENEGDLFPHSLTVHLPDRLESLPYCRLPSAVCGLFPPFVDGSPSSPSYSLHRPSSIPPSVVRVRRLSRGLPSAAAVHIRLFVPPFVDGSPSSPSTVSTVHRPSRRLSFASVLPSYCLFVPPFVDGPSPQARPSLHRPSSIPPSVIRVRRLSRGLPPIFVYSFPHSLTVRHRPCRLPSAVRGLLFLPETSMPFEALPRCSGYPFR